MQTVAILGGAESGTGAALLAKKHNWNVFVSDSRPLKDRFRQILVNNNIPFEEEGHSFEKLEKADIIVKSPGIPDDTEVIRHFRLRQKEIISEIEWAHRFSRARVIAVTGSNGKTTTTSLIHHLIRDEGRIGLGGNIGRSVSGLLAENDDYDWLVLELSSFQLDDIQSFSVDIGIILNVSADHLDRYDNDIEKYADAKWNLALAVKPGGHLVINGDDPRLIARLAEYTNEATVHRLSAKLPMTSWPSKDGDDPFEIQLLGKHNLFNAAVAVKTARLFGMEESRILNRLAKFRALPHRLEPIATYRGVRFINDSKATNVDAVKYALESVPGRIIWIAGGVDKGNDYSILKEEVGKKVDILICLGVDDTSLRAAFEDVVKSFYSTKDTGEAVQLAFRNSQKGDTVLLSPACASFDLFDNYEHRGDTFRNVVLKLLSEDID